MNLKNYYENNPFKKLKSLLTNSLPLLFVLLLSSNSFCQKLVKTVENNSYLHDYQIEKFFLHTNKSSYQPGEKIWFKAYVVNDADNKPSLTTTNLHINIYDTNKKLVSDHLFIVKDGKSTGDILLDKELTFGTYYIELTTQWNQNFINNGSITTINVISQNKLASNLEKSTPTETINKTEITSNVDLQFFPESKVLLEDVKNTIAFTSKLSEIGVSISGDIIDDKTGIIVAKINSNQYGMGQFKLYSRPGRTYTAYVNHNGIQKQFAIPTAQEQGFTISKTEEQNDTKSIDFNLKTNESTIKYEAGKYVYAALHRKGKQKAIIPIKLKKKYINYSFNLLTANLYNGVNTITLFNQKNQPMSEYSFYHSNTNKMDLDVTTVLEQNDSITLNFELLNTTATNVSISVLPKQTKMCNGDYSIETAFLLAPYLENIHLNLNDFIDATQNNENLELLIKTSAKYNMLPYKKNKSNEKNNLILAENGMTVKGNVSANVKNLTNYKVMLSSIENDILLIDSIGQSNTFVFENLYLNKPTNYKLALLDPQGKIVKTEFRLSEELISYNAEDVISKNLEITNEAIKELKTINETSLPLLEDMTLLDEVKVRASFYENNKNKLKDMGIQLSIYDRHADVHLISESENAITIFDYLQRMPGIKVIGNPYTYFVIKSRRGIRSISGDSNMAIIVDGIPMVDTSLLLARMATDFIAIRISQNGAGLGVQGQNGFVSFYTRNGILNSEKNGINKDIHINETELGFDIVSENYENPMMTFPNELTKKYFSTADWVPNFDIVPNTTNHLNVNTNGFSDLKLIINGMNNEGNFIYKVVTIEDNPN